MSVDTVQVLYDQLAQIAQRFQQQSEAINQMYANLQKSYEPLANGDWQGKGAGAFFAKMTNEIFPSTKQLSQGLLVGQQITSQVAQIFQNAEQEAAALFKGGDDMGGDSGRGGGGTTSSVGPANLPPPRIYIVNGINSADPDGTPNEAAAKFEKRLEDLGYDPRQVTATNSIYNTNLNTHLEGTSLEGTKLGGLLSPIDWITGAGANAINGITGAGAKAINAGSSVLNTGVGVAEVIAEYQQGANGKYTQETYKFIMDDLERNPLLPGQQILLVGHSGGGAVVGNLTPMLDGTADPGNSGRTLDVGGVVSMGSPMVNADQIHPYARYVNITDQNDFGQPLIRSSEGRAFLLPALTGALGSVVGGGAIGGLPGVLGGGLVAGGIAKGTLAADQALRDPGTTYYTTHSGNTGKVDSHLSYWTSNEVTDILRNEFNLPLNR